MDNNTIYLDVKEIQKREKHEKIKGIMREVYAALEEKGYNPINQICGYLVSSDPTYITNHNNARALICKIERDELLEEMINSYLNN